MYLGVFVWHFKKSVSTVYMRIECIRIIVMCPVTQQNVRYLMHIICGLHRIVTPICLIEFCCDLSDNRENSLCLKVFF